MLLRSLPISRTLPTSKARQKSGPSPPPELPGLTCLGSEEAPNEEPASVRRTNRTYSFPVSGFHERAFAICSEGTSETRLTSLNLELRALRGILGSEKLEAARNVHNPGLRLIERYAELFENLHRSRQGVLRLGPSPTAHYPVIRPSRELVPLSPHLLIQRESAGYCSAVARQLLLAEFPVESQISVPVLHNPPPASVE